MPANQKQEDRKGLHENQIRHIEEISPCESMFQALTEFEIELGFGRPKIDNDLNDCQS